MSSVNNFLRYIRIFVLPIYWAILTYMLLKPAHLTEEAWYAFNGADKIVHIAIFALFGALFRLSFSKMSISLYCIITIAYGILTEVLQGVMNVGRSMEFLDLLADALGLGIGYLFAERFLGKYLGKGN